MSKYSLIHLMENDLDLTGDTGSRSYEKKTLKLYPKNKSLEEIMTQLENAENYGMYISNLRNNDFIKKGFEKHFGTPVQRRTLTRGGKVTSVAKFAPYTAEAAEQYVGTLLNSIPNEKTRITLLRRVLNWDPNSDGTYLIFYPDKTDVNKKINYILGKAGMVENQDYRLSLEI